MGRPWEALLEQVARERYPRLVAHAMLVAASRSDAQDWREAGTTADGCRVYVPVRADVPIARAVRQWQEDESFAFNPAGDGWVSGADAGYRFSTDLAFHEAHALWAIQGPSGEWQLRLSGDARSVVTECA